MIVQSIFHFMQKLLQTEPQFNGIDNSNFLGRPDDPLLDCTMKLLLIPHVLHSSPIHSITCSWRLVEAAISQKGRDRSWLLLFMRQIEPPPLGPKLYELQNLDQHLISITWCVILIQITVFQLQVIHSTLMLGCFTLTLHKDKCNYSLLSHMINMFWVNCILSA